MPNSNNITFNFNFSSDTQSQPQPQSHIRSPISARPSSPPSQNRERFNTLLESLFSNSSPSDGVRIQFHDIPLNTNIASHSSFEENDRALPFEQVIAHTTVSVVNESSSELCSICRNDFQSGDVQRIITACGHKCHISCIERWFITQRSCPICRSVIGHPHTSNPSTRNSNNPSPQTPNNSTPQNANNPSLNANNQSTQNVNNLSRSDTQNRTETIIGGIVAGIPAETSNNIINVDSTESFLLSSRLLPISRQNISNTQNMPNTPNTPN